MPTTECVCDCGNPLGHVWLYWWRCEAGHVWQVYDRERQDGGEARESASPLVADLVNEIDRLKSATDQAPMPTRARMACVRNSKLHIFLTDTAARDWLMAIGNDWSFAGWVDGIEWHPAGPAEPEEKS